MNSLSTLTLPSNVTFVAPGDAARLRLIQEKAEKARQAERFWAAIQAKFQPENQAMSAVVEPVESTLR